jgi:hypothetical protein
VGPLNLKSLSRSLHCRVPSTEKPSVVEFEVVRTVLEELSLHGEQIFEDWRQRITAATIRAERWHIHRTTLMRDYSFYISLMKRRHPTTVHPEVLMETLNRFNFGIQADGLVDQHDARATLDMERLLREDEGDVNSEHSDHVLSPQGPPDAGRSQEIRSVSNENDLQNMEMITPSSTTDVTVVAASQSAESKIVKTHDSPVSFTHRPVRLKTYTWNVGSTLDFTFDPWTLIMQNQALRNKCEFFRFMRGKLVLDISIQGTDFHSGLAWFVYHPLPGYDEITQYSFGTQPDLIELSQRPRVTISPRESRGGSMTLPFIFPRDYVDLTSDDISKLGSITVRSIVPLRMVNEGSLPCLITVLGHFEDLELVMPTVHPLAQLKVVNESAISDPTSYAAPNVVDGSHAHLSTAPGVMWAPSTDTSVAGLASRECFVGSFIWSTSTGIDSVLGSFRCSPFHGVFTGAGLDTEYHVSPSTWVSLPFSYWSGTCKYRFEVVCSKMHRGQLMLTWDPIYTTKVSEYNKNYSVVFDIGEKDEHVATIGWGQDTPFLPTISSMPEILNHTTSTYISSRKYANGVLTMSVFAPLLLPSKLTESEIVINVYQSMTSDFKLTLPRAPIAATQVDKNDARDDSNSTSVVQSTTVNPVVNPTVTTQKVLLICEESLPLMYATRVSDVISLGGRLDSTFVGPASDVVARLLKLPANAVYQLSSRIPLEVSEPAVIKLRGFVEGNTDITILRLGGPESGAGGDGTAIQTSLSGISATVDVLLNPDSTKFYGSFSMNSTNRTQGISAAYKLPRWAKVTLTWDGVGDLNLAPNVNWYNYTMVNGKPVLGTLDSDQSQVSRSGRAFKIRTFPGHRLMGNLMLSYFASGPTPSPITVYGKTANWILQNTGGSGGSERRHFANDWDPDDICVVPPESVFQPLAITYLIYDTVSTRAAVRAQPVLITNQSALTSEVMHGPQCINSHHGEFFQEIIPDIMILLKRYGVYESVVLNANTGNALPGQFPVKIPHFPLQYRTRLNSTNCSETFAYHYLDYFARAFICMRGSTSVQIRSLTRAVGQLPCFVMIRRDNSVSIVSNTSSTLVDTTPSQQGVVIHALKMNGVCEHTQTWYNPLRFGFARSTSPENHSLHALRLDLGSSSGDRLIFLYKVENDFSLGHFLSTPVLRAYL